ncbi:hypothetical protein BHE74_00035474 [Ensete ventricosum]|nr:hypothetical protein BHE74_00035474 [Ensete ventricosum]
MKCVAERLTDPMQGRPFRLRRSLFVLLLMVVSAVTMYSNHSPDDVVHESHWSDLEQCKKTGVNLRSLAITTNGFVK